MNIVRRRAVAVTLGGLSLAASLSACAAGAGATPDTGTNTNTDTSTAGGRYADGDYSATGEYQSPGGRESIEVDVTLESGVVTSATVVGNATAGNPLRYQTEFEEHIADEVVGVDIDQLSVDKVAGSSLTSDGFNDAIEKIKADAVA